MEFSEPFPTARFFCQQCERETRFLPLYLARRYAGVSRTTLYYWIRRDWVHYRRLASGRRVVCQESLSRQGESTSTETVRARRNPSQDVQSGSIR